MLKLFVGPERTGIDSVRILAKYRNARENSSRLFQPVTVRVEEIFQIVDDIGSADAILFPHEFSAVTHDAELHATYERLAESSNKKILVFFFGDRDLTVPMRHAVVLRTSVYRFKMRDNEVIAVPFVEDLGSLHGFSVRHKKNNTPVVGFVGLAQWSTWRSRVKAYLRQGVLLCRAVCTGKRELRAQTQGIFIRRRALRALAKSSRVQLRSRVRSSFSALEKTVSTSPQQAREEYVRSIQDSDAYLAPKGDGNYSLRFFETLSLGRIPVLIDTETVLPFEDRVSYDDVIIRIPLSSIDRIADIVADWFENMSDEEFIRRQRRAREVFTSFLSQESFYRILFDEFAQTFRSG